LCPPTGTPFSSSGMPACGSSTSTAAPLSLLSGAGSSVWAVAAAASASSPPCRDSGAVAVSANTASSCAASAAALQATVVVPASTNGASQLQPVGAATTRSGRAASNTKPAPGNSAASGP